MTNKILIIEGIFFFIAIIFTTLVLTNVLNIKFMCLSMMSVAAMQFLLGFYARKIKRPYKLNFIAGTILIISGICFLFL